MLLLFLISLFAAFIFSLGGVGAAIVLIPIMVSMGIPVNIAKPVGLFYNTISLSGATYSNIKNKRLDVRLGIPIIVSSFFFAVIGAYISKFIPAKVILILFIIFLIFSSFIFFISKKGKDRYREDVPYLALGGVGALAGLLSGLLGIGGGGIISPLMLMLGFNPKKITTVTAFAVPFSSFSGFLTYWAMGSVNWKLMLIVSLGGLIGASIGTNLMHERFHPQTVKKVLAVILLILAVKLMFKV